MSRACSPPPAYEHGSSLKPYLELPHLLSLTWLAYPILSLVFIAFRLQLSLASSQDAIASAKDNLMASCLAAERAATGAISLPRYLAMASNEQFADAVNAMLRGARAALILSLTMMEAIINFLIDLYRSTFLCFLELVIRGGLSILIGAVQEINDFLTNTFNNLRTSIQEDVASANRLIQGAVDAFNRINPFGDVTIPTFDIPSLSGLQNVALPSSLQDSLTKLNDTIPTVDEIKGKLETIINTPFELVKKEVNDTFANLTMDASVLPVPQQNSVTFCADMDLSVVDNLGQDIVKSARIGLGIIIGLIILLIAANCALEWYKWRCVQAHLEYTRQAWQTDPTIVQERSSMPTVTLTNHNLLMLENNMANPLITRLVNQLSRVLRLCPSKHVALQWFLSYIFHAPALAVFLIGFFGLVCVQLQLWALGPLEAKYKAATAATVADFSNTIAASVNESMYAQSAQYAADVNARVQTMQDSLDGGVFGWIDVTTTELNTTINAFYDNIQEVVDDVFGGTILETPAKEFIRCLIGTKVDAIENALTFLHDNVQVELPRMNDSVLILSPETVNETTKPIAAAAIGGENDDGGVIGKIVRSYANTLRQERTTFAIFMGIWGFVVFMGICILFWHSYGKSMVEAYGRRKWRKTQRSGFDDIVVPFRQQDTAATGGHTRHRSTASSHIPTFSSTAPDPQGNKETLLGGKKPISRPFPLRPRGGDIESQTRPNPFSRFLQRFAREEVHAPVPERPRLTINVERASARATSSSNIQIEHEYNPTSPSSPREQQQPKSAWSVTPPTASRLQRLSTLTLKPWTTRKTRDTLSGDGLQPPLKPSRVSEAPIPIHHAGFDQTRYPLPAATASAVALSPPIPPRGGQPRHSALNRISDDPFDDLHAGKNPFAPVAL